MPVAGWFVPLHHHRPSNVEDGVAGSRVVGYTLTVPEARRGIQPVCVGNKAYLHLLRKQNFLKLLRD
jgi:hypothetical protein